MDDKPDIRKRDEKEWGVEIPLDLTVLADQRKSALAAAVMKTATVRAPEATKTSTQNTVIAERKIVPPAAPAAADVPDPKISQDVRSLPAQTTVAPVAQ